MSQESGAIAPAGEIVSRDRLLVKRMLAGDERAFDEFADTYTSALYRFAMSRLDGERELARDIVQTSLCKGLAKLGSYRGEAALFTWLCSVCNNEIRMHFRSRKTAPIESPLEDDNVRSIDSRVRTSPDQEEALLSGETAEIVHMVLDLLPKHYSDALEWKYLDRISVKEIGQRLRVGAKAAESMLSRARQAFRDEYARIVGELCAPGSLSRSGPGGGAD